MEAGAVNLGRILVVSFFELAKQFVAPLYGIGQSLGGRLRTVPDGFHFLVDHVSDLDEIAEPDAT